MRDRAPGGEALSKPLGRGLPVSKPFGASARAFGARRRDGPLSRVRVGEGVDQLLILRIGLDERLEDTLRLIVFASAAVDLAELDERRAQTIGRRRVVLLNPRTVGAARAGPGEQLLADGVFVSGVADVALMLERFAERAADEHFHRASERRA